MNTGKVEFAPDYKSEKKGVMFSRKTGGAYADPREVIEDELTRIREQQGSPILEAEHARLKDAVVEAAKVRRDAEKAATVPSDFDVVEAERHLRSTVDALIAVEAE